MTEAERRAEENKRILERMEGVKAQYDPFAKFDPTHPSAQAPNHNDNEGER